MQSARPRATFRSRRSTCAGRRARSSSVKVRAQLSQLGVGAIEQAFLSVFGHMKGHVCQRGRRSGQTQVMVYRMGISMEPVCLHGRIGMFLSEDGYILSRVRRGPTSLCPHGPGEPSGALGRPRGGPPWPSGGWTDPRARGRNPRGGGKGLSTQSTSVHKTKEHLLVAHLCFHRGASCMLKVCLLRTGRYSFPELSTTFTPVVVVNVTQKL